MFFTSYDDALTQASSLTLSGDLHEAETIYQELIKIYPEVPNKASTYYGYGCLEIIRQNFNKAYELIKKALDYSPFHEGYRELGKLNIVNGKTKAGIRNIEKALIYKSDCEECKSLLAQLKSPVKVIQGNDNLIKGVYEKSKDYDGAKYTEIYPEETVHRTLPKASHEFDDYEAEKSAVAFKRFSTNVCQESFVINIPNGSAYSRHLNETCFFTSDNMLLADIKNFNNIHDQEIIKKGELPDPIYVGDKLLVLTSDCGGSNYHWITTVIPRLHLLEKAGYRLSDFDKIILDYGGLRFQRDIIFKYLGIPEDKLIGSIRNGAHFKAKNIVTASIQIENPQWSTLAIRDKFIRPEVFTEKQHKIYISRNDSHKRRILNEDMVTNYLDNLGFKTVYLEGLPFEEQISLFANAEAIVAPHGAALTNLAFCKPGTKVIEIVNPEWYQDCFFRIGQNVGVDYYFMIANPQPGETLDININMQRLHAALCMANIV